MPQSLLYERGNYTDSLVTILILGSLLLRCHEIPKYLCMFLRGYFPHEFVVVQHTGNLVNLVKHVTSFDDLVGTTLFAVDEHKNIFDHEAGILDSFDRFKFAIGTSNEVIKQKNLLAGNCLGGRFFCERSDLSAAVVGDLRKMKNAILAIRHQFGESLYKGVSGIRNADDVVEVFDLTGESGVVIEDLTDLLDDGRRQRTGFGIVGSAQVHEER